MTHSTLVVSVLAASSLVLVGCTSSPTTPSATFSSGSTPLVSGGGEPGAQTSARGGRPAAGGVIYVTGQDLYYSTFATVDPLPMHGPFQPLYPSDKPGVGGETPYGPGDPGYVGGRWWVDDGDIEGVQDENDHFFLCPLIGPGREEP